MWLVYTETYQTFLWSDNMSLKIDVLHLWKSTQITETSYSWFLYITLISFLHIITVEDSKAE